MGQGIGPAACGIKADLRVFAASGSINGSAASVARPLFSLAVNKDLRIMRPG
jgi:hypothetical protein